MKITILEMVIDMQTAVAFAQPPRHILNGIVIHLSPDSRLPSGVSSNSWTMIHSKFTPN